MNRVLVLGALLLAGAGAMAAGAAQQPSASQTQGQQAPSAAALQVDKVKDNLFVLRGGGGNTAVLVTSTGVVLVDTKLPGWGQPILEKLKEITDKPVTVIVNTHTHFDHLGGNVEFANVEVVAHENTARLMKEMRPVTGGPEQPNVFKDSNGRGLATRTFTDTMTLGSGAERIELRYFGPAHTNGDAWVVFPAHRVVHSGDVFPNKGIPLIDANNGGSGVEYPRTMAKAVAGLTDIDTVITGHFETTLTTADLKMYADFTRAMVDAVQSAKASGRTIDDVMNTWEVPERFLNAGYRRMRGDPRQGPVRFRQNVELIWNETK